MDFALGPLIVFGLAFLFIYNDILTGPRQRLWLVILGSLAFYSTLNLRFVPVLLGSALFDFIVARQIARDRPSKKRRSIYLLFASVAVNLSVLLFFKYRYFLFGGVPDIFRVFGFAGAQSSASWLVPVGISFYVLQSLSYVLDVYRDDLAARESPYEFIAGVCFFPHLLAGPILRPVDLLPQFENLKRVASSRDFQRGATLVAVGLVKKELADFVAPYSDQLFSNPAGAGFLSSWVGVLAFTAQIYGDFSGYTDMAIGFAAMLGITLPKNFNYPYASVNPIDYWKRWHITLGSWFHDYFYSPLTMTMMRSGLGGPFVGVMTTMLVLGLWHGASWGFAAFGLFHGVLICATHVAGGRFKGIFSPKGWRRALQILLTFYAAVIGHVLFRADSLKHAWTIIQRMHTVTVTGLSGDLGQFGDLLALVLAILIGLHFVNRLSDPESMVQRKPQLAWVVSGFVFFMALSLRGETRPFIYFQF